MTSPLHAELSLPDLDKVIDAAAATLTQENEVTSIAALAGLVDFAVPSGRIRPKARWTPVFEAALDEPPETLAKLLKQIRRSLGVKPKGRFDHAVQEMRVDCVSRVTRTANLTLSDQLEDLSSAFPPERITEPAQRLRSTALGVRRLLMRPLLAETFLQLERELGFPTEEPEWLRLQLANQAMNVVTALDYLLTLMMTPDITPSQLSLGMELGSDRSQGRTDEEAHDWLTRRRLYARSTAVSEATRLLVMLRRDIALE